MREHRRALAFLGEQQIARVLALPVGARVIGVRDDFMRMGVLVMVEGDMYEPVPEAANPPQISTLLLPAPDRAMRATVHGDNGDSTEARCPEGCDWFWVAEGGPVSLADVVAVVSLHLAEAHPLKDGS